MNTGKLRHRITILQRSFETTRGVSREFWSEIRIVWASVEPLVGREFFAAAAVNSENTIKFRIRYNKEIAQIQATDLQIKYNNKTYDVYSIVCPFEARKELVLMSKQSLEESDGSRI